MTVYKWSQTAATNATADSTINWAEGQSPSSVNDSARALMAAVAKYRDDNAGSLTTGGTSTAYTLTSNQVFSSLSVMSGMSLRVKFDKTNGAAATLNVDGLGAKALQTVAGTALPSGYINANSVHDVVYDNTNSAWIVVTPPYPFPSTTRMLFQQTSAPGGWTKDTSSYNNYALRLVTGSVGSGGSTGFTSVFGSRTITQGNLPSVNFSHSLSVGTSITNGTLVIRGGSGSNFTASGGLTTFANVSQDNLSLASGSVSGTVSSGGSGTAMDFAVLYADAIIAAKD